MCQVKQMKMQSFPVTQRYATKANVTVKTMWDLTCHLETFSKFQLTIEYSLGKQEIP